MNLRISLLTLIGLTALIALELATLKTVQSGVLSCIEFFVDGSLLVATWGAFLLTGKLRLFSKGFSVLGWAFVLATVFTNMDGSSYYQSELAKLAAEVIGHDLASLDLVIPSSLIDPTKHYFKLWFLWSILNLGLLGGFAALRLNTISSAKEPVASDSDKLQRD